MSQTEQIRTQTASKRLPGLDVDCGGWREGGELRAVLLSMLGQATRSTGHYFDVIRSATGTTLPLIHLTSQAGHLIGPDV